MKYTRAQLDIVIIPEKEEGYSAKCIQIPNVVTQGKTVEEAREMLKEALELYFEEMPEEKDKIIQSIKVESTPFISRIFL